MEIREPKDGRRWLTFNYATRFHQLKMPEVGVSNQLRSMLLCQMKGKHAVMIGKTTSSLLFFVFLILVASCVNDVASPVNTDDYFLFGTLGAFRVNPDILFKVKDGQVYTTQRQRFIDVNNLPAFAHLAASDSLLNAIRNLRPMLPAQLLTESQEFLGQPLPDAGHLYIEIGNSLTKRHWYLEANPPSYLVQYQTRLRNVISKASN